MNRKEALNYLVDNVGHWDEGGFPSLLRQNITELFNGGWISICGFLHKGNERHIKREDWIEAKRIMNKHECIEWAAKNIGDWDKMKTRGKPYMPKGWYCDQSGDVVFYRENFEDVICRKDWVEAKKAMNRKEWVGEGLPPVGIKCEAKHFNSFEPVEIVAHVRSIDCIKAVWQLIGYNEWGYYGEAEHFRPLKTEAEKERERLVDLASKVITRKTGSYLSVGQKEIIDTLVDSGWKCSAHQKGELNV